MGCIVCSVCLLWSMMPPLSHVHHVHQTSTYTVSDCTGYGGSDNTLNMLQWTHPLYCPVPMVAESVFPAHLVHGPANQISAVLNVAWTTAACVWMISMDAVSSCPSPPLPPLHPSITTISTSLQQWGSVAMVIRSPVSFSSIYVFFSATRGER